MVEAAVVTDGDDAADVDFVVADVVVRRDLIAGGEGFGPGVERLDGGASVQRPVGSDGVVVGQEIVELGLQFGDRSCRW